MSNCQNCQWPHMLKKLQTSNWIISTTFGMKIQKYLSCHHPARLPEKHLGFGGMTGGRQKTYHPKNQTAGGIRVEDEGMNLEKKDPWVPTWICQKHQVYLGTVYHSLIPYVFFDILLGKWYILRWIRQVPKTTRMYFFQFGVLGFAGLALGKCSKHTLPNGGAYLVGGFNPPEKY